MNLLTPAPALDVNHRFQAATVRRRLERLAHIVEREAMANQWRDPHDTMLDELQRGCEVVRGEVMAAGKTDLAVVNQVRIDRHLGGRVGSGEGIYPPVDRGHVETL